MNTVTNIWRATIFLALCIIVNSCSNELHMYLPEGPSGATGKSAYELWVEAVNDGTIDWPKDQTDISNFFFYFKGADGKDGENAYDMWVEEVAKGIENPHDTGNEWPKDKTELNDFWYYLTGADGKNGLSAYELWKEEVTSTEGLQNPHDENGGKWPADKTSLEDFWEYLQGKDGKLIVKPQPIPGKINVIAQYSNTAGNNYEYVNWKDGSVLYKVTDENGDLAPDNTTVTINIDGTEKTYTITGEKGEFTIPKDDLPTNQTNADINFKTTIVVIPGKNPANSAPVTYVPCKIEVRINIIDVPVLGRINYKYPSIDIEFEVQRKVDAASGWERIPAFIGDTRRHVDLYEVDAANGNINQQISEPLIGRGSETNRIMYDVSLTCKLQVERKITDSYLDLLDAYTKLNLSPPVTNKDELKQQCPFYWGTWDKLTFHYFTLGITDCYGETPKMDAAIRDVPVQLMPIPENMSAHAEETLSPLEYLIKMEGEFRISDNLSSFIDYTLCFKNKYTKNNSVPNIGNTYNASELGSGIDRTKGIFAISFDSSSDGQRFYIDNTKDPSSLNKADFEVYAVTDEANISVFPHEETMSTWNFYPIENWSTLILEISTDLQCYLEINTNTEDKKLKLIYYAIGQKYKSLEPGNYDDTIHRLKIATTN